MASTDFDLEKANFRAFYDGNSRILDDAKNSLISLIRALVTHDGGVTISKIEGRVKDREECITKFNLKYRTELEKLAVNYSIRDHISDLIGLRIVCLYEDDIEKVKESLARHLTVVDITNKIELIENTEGSFGYKGLHLDLQLDPTRRLQPEHQAHAEYNFEVQIRTIVQDSWSVLDHKIKYKKSIPNRLKRRINTLAALFELADREFRLIRDATDAELALVNSDVAAGLDVEDVFPEDPIASQQVEILGADNKEVTASVRKPIALDAFGFLRIANHFFKGFDFEPHKVDGFTEEVNALSPGITRGKFNFYMRSNIARVKQYQRFYEAQSASVALNPFTLIRHCLYLGDEVRFQTLLTNVARTNFDNWLKDFPDDEHAGEVRASP